MPRGFGRLNSHRSYPLLKRCSSIVVFITWLLSVKCLQLIGQSTEGSLVDISVTCIFHLFVNKGLRSIPRSTEGCSVDNPRLHLLNYSSLTGSICPSIDRTAIWCTTESQFLGSFSIKKSCMLLKLQDTHINTIFEVNTTRKSYIQDYKDQVVQKGRQTQSQDINSM